MFWWVSNSDIKKNKGMMAQAQAAKWGTSQVREWHRLAAHIQPNAQQLNSYTTNKFTTNKYTHKKKQPTTSHSTSCNTTLYNLQLVHNAFAQHTTTFNHHGKSSCDPHLVLWYGEDFDPTWVVVVLSSGSDPFTSLCHLINCPLPANQGTLSCLTKWRVQTICWHDVHLLLGSISTFQ